MNKLKITAAAMAALLSFPFVALAVDDLSHGEYVHGNESEVKHADHEQEHDMHHEQAGVTSGGTMMIVGSQISKGVRGMAHLNDTSAVMAKMGLLTTHHFMIAFVDEATGEQVENGTVALKITNPDAKIGETIELVGMDGHFGADVALDMEGEYHFRLGTKLSDGVKRKYHFHQVVE